MLKMETQLNRIEKFWKSIEGANKLTQLQRYENKNSPEYIKKFIAIGGGPRMGVTLEKFARFHFSTLKPRGKGKAETGYDHKLTIGEKSYYVEQKSSGHWGEDDYKWQHVEEKHKWNILLLCGIDYTDIVFWGMNRATFNKMITEKKITNQGNHTGESSEGMWFNYSDVKEHLTEIKTNEELIAFVSSQENTEVIEQENTEQLDTTDNSDNSEISELSDILETLGISKHENTEKEV